MRPHLQNNDNNDNNNNNDDMKSMCVHTPLGAAVPYIHLSIPQATAKDTGVYSLVYLEVAQGYPSATSKSSSSSGSKGEKVVRHREAILLQVDLRMTQVPYATTTPKFMQKQLGSEFVFGLSATGVPQPSFQWYRNGFALIDQTGPTLKKKGLTRNDEGTYTCVLRNIAGEFHWAELSVQVTE